MISDRKTGEVYHEKVYNSKTMDFLYKTAIGGVCVLFLRLPIVSKIYGHFQRSRKSQKKIWAFAKEYSLKVTGDYKSFNDFFIRKETRSFDNAEESLISPADSCLTVCQIENGSLIQIKGKSYGLAKLLKDKKLAEAYAGGLCLIFRLRVYDYHRYCFIDSGKIKNKKKICGFLDSVNESATGKFTLCSNARKVSVLETQNLGEIVFIEIGAMLVGRIVSTHSHESFRKGEEKGYFEFGGSSIVILLKRGAVTIDEDILRNAEKGIETVLHYGERIGVKR